MIFNKEMLLLYAVTDRSWLNGRTLYEQVEDALKGGATFIQLREKKLDKEDFLKEAIEIQALCRQYHVPFVINDDVDKAAKEIISILTAEKCKTAERVQFLTRKEDK